MRDSSTSLRSAQNDAREVEGDVQVRPQATRSFGVYECRVAADGGVAKGKRLGGGPIERGWGTDELVQAAERIAQHSEKSYPLIVESWWLKSGPVPDRHPATLAGGKLNLTEVGLIQARRMAGFPIRRQPEWANADARSCHFRSWAP